jgi:predicted acylesterase/phospholipase RssA
VGTSIGAVNGAAITQGVTAEQLEAFWLSLREYDVQGLPPTMGPLARRVSNFLLKRSIGARLSQISPDKAMSPPAEESWPPIPILPPWLAERLIGRWTNLLDTAPLRDTLLNRLGLDEAEIAASPITLLINAINVRTGEGVVFSNRPLKARDSTLRESEVHTGITLKRIIASCSIPLMYPWTRDDNGEVYWDGALVANTPLGAAFDAVSERPLQEPMEIVIVLLNPWWEKRDGAVPRHRNLPDDFAEAATWALDWTMLASFRVSLKMLHAFNKLIDRQLAMGLEQQYRRCLDIMVAPQDFLPVTRIIDYDEPASRSLIHLGYEAAEQAFRMHFPAVS